MIGKFRKTFETEEGQAIVLGAMMMLLLAFGVLMTLNIGKAVKEKIHLQNSSDASAYSMAVIEAQTFNFIAFTNRVQAAHYNAIMTMQTYATIMIFIESIMGTIWDFCATLATILTYLGITAEIGVVIGEIATGIGAILTIYRKALYIDPQEPKLPGIILDIGLFKEVMWYLNYAQYFTSVLVGGLVWGHIIDNMSTVTKMNESRIETSWMDSSATQNIYRIITLGLNAYDYLKVYDKAGGGIPPLPHMVWNQNSENGSLRKLTKYKTWHTDDSNHPSLPRDYNNPNTRHAFLKKRNRVMGEIANATRAELFNTKRGFSIPPDSWGIVASVIKRFFEFNISGQTKIISRNGSIAADKGDRFNVNVYPEKMESENSLPRGVVQDIRSTAIDHSRFPVGDVMASDQSFSLWVGLSLGIPGLSEIGIGELTLLGFGLGVYILSDNYGGEFWHWKTPGRYPIWIYAPWNETLTWSPDQAYLRIPIRPWDLLGSIFTTAIELCRDGWLPPTPFVGCKLSSPTGVKRGCGPSFSFKMEGSCRDKRRACCCGDCWCIVCCTGLAKMCCKMEAFLKQRFPTHEAVCGDDAKQYYFGIGPYVKFAPNPARSADFNQPSTWTILNLPAESVLNYQGGGKALWTVNDNKRVTLRTGATEKTMHFDPLTGSDGSNFSSTRPLEIFDPGLNAFSRARVYYHRPGNWEEHPNFFNPYWRAQLAPIAQKMTSLMNDVFNVDGVSESGGAFDIGTLAGNLKDLIVGGIQELFIRVIPH